MLELGTIRFSHFVIAIRTSNPKKAIEIAAEEGWFYLEMRNRYASGELEQRISGKWTGAN